MDAPLLEISRAQLEMLAHWFQPETPGPVIAPHVMHTGCGRAWVDRWPNARAIAVETNYNFVMAGDPSGLDPMSLSKTVAGFVAAPPTFLPILEETFPTLEKWPRIIGTLTDEPIHPPVTNADVRRLCADDGDDLEALSAEVVWVTQTWGGGRALARSGYGWGAWVDGRLAAVACSFFVGNQFEDIGVVTEPQFRRTGLSTACAYELCRDITARGRTPSWTTSTDNMGSWRVAEKLGFAHQRHDWLYIVGRPVPKVSN